MRVVAVFRERYEGEHGAFALKMAEEASELANDPDDLEEAADVLITMLGWLDAKGLTWSDLLSMAMIKMAINEERVWERREDGTWQHVEGSDAAGT